MNEIKNKLINRAELAKWLGLSIQTISNRLSNGGDLPFSVKSGCGYRRWRVQDVLEWIENRIEKPYDA